MFYRNATSISRSILTNFRASIALYLEQAVNNEGDYELQMSIVY